jgi:hypothetical protein
MSKGFACYFTKFVKKKRLGYTVKQQRNEQRVVSCKCVCIQPRDQYVLY